MYIRIDFGSLACKHKISKMENRLTSSRKISVL